MVCVLHLLKIQVSLTEQSFLIHIFFVSCIKDFFSPSCWRLWEGYATHSCARNFWLPPSGAGAAGGGSGGGRAASRRSWQGLSGFCGCLPCSWHHALVPGQGQRMESVQERAARGGFASAVPHGFTLAGCAGTPCRRALCVSLCQGRAGSQPPRDLSHALCFQSWGRTGSSRQLRAGVAPLPPPAAELGCTCCWARDSWDLREQVSL